MSIAEANQISIRYNQELESLQEAGLGYGRTDPAKAHGLLYNTLSLAPTFYGTDEVSREVHEARLRRDVALAKARKHLDAIGIKPSLATPVYIQQLKKAERSLHTDPDKLNNILKLNLNPEARVEVENQIAASEGHMARIAVASYCVLHAYPTAHDENYSTPESIQEIATQAQERLSRAYGRLRQGTHNPYFIASLAGNRLRSAAVTGNVESGQRKEVVKIASWCLRNALVSSDYRRGLITSGRLLLQSVTRKSAIASILRTDI